MPSVAEVLKATGFTDEQIAALDPKLTSAFSIVLSEAATDRERAEVERRSNLRFYDESISPALTNWASEKAQKDAEVAYFKTQLESARASGFLPADLPEQPRDASGRYLPNQPGGTPGSPTFTMDQIDARLGSGIANVGWAMQEYARHYNGQVLPDSFEVLAQEADRLRLPFRDHVARKYDFETRRRETQERQQREHDDRIRRETEDAVNRKWSEKIGSNPDVRIQQASQYSEVSRAVKAGQRQDPLSMNDSQRRAATSQAIRQEIAERDRGEAA